MASVHAMPPDTREKEKIIGGIMDIYQFGFFIAGLLGCAIVTVSLFKYISWGSLLLGLPLIAVGCLFAFFKVGEMRLFTYLRYKIKYSKKTKCYVNAGFHTELEFDVEQSEMINSNKYSRNRKGDK